MVFKKAILLSTILLFSHFISAQNRIFLRDETPVDVKYLTVTEEYLIVLKTNDTLKIKRRIPIDLIDSLQCDNFEFIQSAYEANTKYRSIVRYTRSKSTKTTTIDTIKTNDNKHPDTISVSKSGSGYRYKGEYIRQSRLNEILESENVCRQYVSKAKVNKVFYYIFGYPGAFLIGYSLGTAIGGGEVNLPMLGIGGALTVVSIPFIVSYNSNLKMAIKKFNAIQIKKAVNF